MLALGLQAQMKTSLVCPSSVVTWLAAICSPVVAPLVSGRAVSVPFAAAPLRPVVAPLSMQSLVARTKHRPWARWATALALLPAGV